jgi:hypothetical protein
MGAIFSSSKKSSEYGSPRYSPSIYEEQNPTQNSYKISKGDVYWKGIKIVGADGHTFESTTDGYGHDAVNRYYRGRKTR